MVFEEEIVQIAESIWMSILNLPVEVDHEGKAKVGAAGERTLTGCVHLTGDWEGAVLLFCTQALAGRAASIMFATELDELTVEEIQDALGELTNMTAGNVKPLLPGSSRLSLPSVVEGLDYNLMVPGSKVVAEVGFSCEGHPLIVSLLRKKGDT